MPEDELGDSRNMLEQGLASAKNAVYSLSLYVTGATPKSTRAIANVTAICNAHLKDRYELEIIDIYQQPERARAETIIATPTLVKHLPHPLRKLVGDMSDESRVLAGLGLS